jgi:hypothetical protein
MEATMHQPIKKSAPDNNNTNGGIADLIKYTPSLEQYIVANILTKCGRPEGYEGKYKFSSMMVGSRATDSMLGLICTTNASVRRHRPKLCALPVTFLV